MGEEQKKQVDSETSQAEGKTPNHDSSEKPLIPVSEKKLSPSKATLQSEMLKADAANHEEEKGKADSKDRDAALARIEVEKRLALIKAWEESEKSKADNKAYKKLSAVGAWENTKRASIEAELKQIEEDFEKKKAQYAEKMKNKIAEMHKEAEEKRATVEAKRGEDVLKIEETAAKFRSTGNVPKRLFGCFTC